VPLSQLLHLDIAEFGQGRGQVHPVSVQRRGFEAVFGGQPALTCFGERDAIWVVVAHLLGLVGRSGESRCELPCLRDRERMLSVQLVHHDVA
jgi:hypothetical protein